MDSTAGGDAPEHQSARHRRPPAPPTPDSSVGSTGDEPDPTSVIEIGVDVRPEAGGTWSVVLTPAIGALRTKHRTGLGSLADVAAEVARMLGTLDYGGFPVATTWTLDGDPAAWTAWAAHDPLPSLDTEGHRNSWPAVEAEAGR